MFPVMTNITQTPHYQRAQIQQAIITLLNHYSFDAGDRSIPLAVHEWVNEYSLRWIVSAVIEALYQGRYKTVSVEQILIIWQRRGQPIAHFNREFERMVCGQLLDPRTTAKPHRSDTKGVRSSSPSLSNPSVPATPHSTPHASTPPPVENDSPKIATQITSEAKPLTIPKDTSLPPTIAPADRVKAIPVEPKEQDHEMAESEEGSNGKATSTVTLEHAPSAPHLPSEKLANTSANTSDTVHKSRVPYPVPKTDEKTDPEFVDNGMTSDGRLSEMLSTDGAHEQTSANVNPSDSVFLKKSRSHPLKQRDADSYKIPLPSFEPEVTEQRTGKVWKHFKGQPIRHYPIHQFTPSKALPNTYNKLRAIAQTQ